MNVRNYTISDEGVVDVDGRCDVGPPFGSPNERVISGSIPYQFGTVTGTFSCALTELSLFDGVPKVVDGDFFCDQTKIKSLSGIEKHIQHIGGGFFCDDGVTNILGLLLIEGLTHVNIDQNGPIDRVINKYLGTGDILSAQDELIDAGCIEQASL